MAKAKEDAFEKFLCERGDEIDNAVHAMLETIAQKPVDWDIQFSLEIVEKAEWYLSGKGIEYCDPFFTTEGARNGTEEIPCYRGEECTNPDCPMKSDHKKGA